MKRAIKSTALELMARPWISRLLMAGGRPRSVIVMLHRFATPNGVHRGHDPRKLRHVLEALHASKIGLVDIETAIDAMDPSNTESSKKQLTVSFSIDDGYEDLLSVGAPIFAEFDCPVTTFVVPDVIDGKSWFWWDQVDWILRHSASKSLQVEIEDRPLVLKWETEASRQALHQSLSARLKQLPHSALLDFLQRLSQKAEVSIPFMAPPEYRVLSWDELRSVEKVGIRVGAHSLSHPILSKCDDARSRHEIVQSVSMVNAQLSNPSSVFCYPNGKRGDFGIREIAAVRSTGVRAALTSEPALLRRDSAHWDNANARYLIPRFSYDERAGGLARMFLGW